MIQGKNINLEDADITQNENTNTDNANILYENSISDKVSENKQIDLQGQEKTNDILKQNNE